MSDVDPETSANEPTAAALRLSEGALPIRPVPPTVTPRPPAILQQAEREAAQLGERFFYQWAVRNRAADDDSIVDGVTAEGALMLLRVWGNAVCLPELIDESAEHWLFRACFLDLLTGCTIVRLYRKQRTPPPGRYDAHRWADMQFSDGQSRAMRNAICAGLPNGLLERCKAAARGKACAELDPAAERARLLERAAEVGVEEKAVCDLFGKQLVDFDAQEMISLRAALRAVESGWVPVGAIFHGCSAETAEELRDRISPAAETGSQQSAALPQLAARISSATSLQEIRELGAEIAQAKKRGELGAAEARELKNLSHRSPFWPSGAED